mmetsp:Transcript_17332/g.47057  ORF Transcript_17332/g.47057 Transcript_17332/m.47057 type:complete len:436 (+) Transcript_17332:1197-2504(+)
MIRGKPDVQERIEGLQCCWLPVEAFKPIAFHVRVRKPVLNGLAQSVQPRLSMPASIASLHSDFDVKEPEMSSGIKEVSDHKQLFGILPCECVHDTQVFEHEFEQFLHPSGIALHQHHQILIESDLTLGMGDVLPNPMRLGAVGAWPDEEEPVEARSASRDCDRLHRLLKQVSAHKRAMQFSGGLLLTLCLRQAAHRKRRSAIRIQGLWHMPPFADTKTHLDPHLPREFALLDQREVQLFRGQHGLVPRCLHSRGQQCIHPFGRLAAECRRSQKVLFQNAQQYSIGPTASSIRRFQGVVPCGSRVTRLMRASPSQRLALLLSNPHPFHLTKGVHGTDDVETTEELCPQNPKHNNIVSVTVHTRRGASGAGAHHATRRKGSEGRDLLHTVPRMRALHALAMGATSAVLSERSTPTSVNAQFVTAHDRQQSAKKENSS